MAVNFFRFCLTKAEMLALTLADFDFKANTINVSKTLYRNRTGAPKTDNSNRAITIPPAIMAEIKEYANKIYGIQPQDRVFAFSKESLRRNMIRYCELSGIPRVMQYKTLTGSL